MNDDPLMRVMRNIKTSPGPGVGEAIDKSLPPYATLSPAPEAPQDDGGATAQNESGWLVEFRRSVCGVPTFYLIGDDPDAMYTTNASNALRFARKTDAECFIEREGWTKAFASEHIWVAPTRADTDPAVNAFESNKRLVDDLVAALEKAREFIVNGKEYGYIRMPDPGSGDTALNTVPVIDAALSKAKAKPGEQK